MAKVGSLNILIGATTGGLSKGFKKAEAMTQQFSTKVSKFVTGPGGIGGAIASAVGGVTVAAGIAYAVKQFSQVEESQVRLQNAFKATGGAAGQSVGDIQKLAMGLSETTRFSTTATMNAAAGLAKFQNIKGPNFQETIKQAQNLATVTGKDLPGATEQLGEALQVPRTGYLELAKAGVMFSDQQVDQIQSMSDAGNVAGAQTVILQALQSQYEGAAEAAGGTMAGKLDILHHSLENIAGIIGEAVAPVIKVVVGDLNAWLDSLDKVRVRNVAFEIMARAIGFVADTIQVMQIGWAAAKVGADWMLFGAIKAAALLATGLEKSVNWLRHLAGLKEISIGAKSLNDFADGAKQVALENAKALETAEKAPWASSNVDKFFAETKAKADEMNSHIETGAKTAGDALMKGPVAAMHQLSAKAIEAQSSIIKMIEDLKMANKYFGMDDRQRQIAELGGKGATKKQQQQAAKLAANLRSQELAQEFEDPIEKFQREMEKLNQTKKLGTLDQNTYNKARSKLVMDLQSAAPQQKVSAGGAMMAGSAEARSAFLQFRGNQRSANPQVQLQRTQDMQLEQQKLSVWYLQQLVKAQPQVAAFAGL